MSKSRKMPTIITTDSQTEWYPIDTYVCSDCVVKHKYNFQFAVYEKNTELPKFCPFCGEKFRREN